MKIAACYFLNGTPYQVFARATDAVTLKQCIPGCESLDSMGEGGYQVVIRVGVAGLKGTYKGTARLTDVNPPHSLSIAVDGKGAPGFVRGTAAVTLSGTGDGTKAACDADVQVGGAIVAVGSRLIQAAAKKMMDDFFKCLSEDRSGSSALPITAEACAE